MKNIVRIPILLPLLLLLTFSNGSLAEVSKPKPFDAMSLKPMIQNLSKQWSKGLADKDIEIFRDLYDEKAHYLPNEDSAIHGKDNIANYWRDAFGFVFDLELNMDSLQGTEDLLYETGTGTVTIINQSGNKGTIDFKYVNVWKKQIDGSYKVVIDTFNMPAPEMTQTEEELVKYFNSFNPLWKKAVETDDPSYIIARYADNAIVGAPNKEFIVGKKEIAKYVKGNVEFLDGFSYETQKIGGNPNDIIYEAGVAYTTYTVDGVQRTEKSKYIFTWKYIGDGQYQILSEMFNQ